MDYQIMTSPADEDENLLFAFQFNYGGQLLKGAVAESLNEKIAEEGIYDVLLQTVTGNHCFEITLDENAIWKANKKEIDQYIVDEIGKTIENITE